MNIDVTSLPSIIELNSVDYTINLVYGETESDGVIDSFTVNATDSGVTLSYVDESAYIQGTGYEEAFASQIGYAKPQIDPLAKPEYVEGVSWGPVPEPGDTENIWFLYKYKAPDVMTRTYTYTVSGTYTDTPVSMVEDPVSGESSSVPQEPILDIPFTFSFTQVVNYDLDTNIAEFKRYI